MPSKEEIAYADALRSIDGQTQDLENIRSHVALALTGSGIAAAVLIAKDASRTGLVLAAIVVFVVIAGLTVYVHLSVSNWAYDFAMDQRIPRALDDASIEPDRLLRDLALGLRAGHEQNRRNLDRLWTLHNAALVLFAVEVVMLLINLAVS